MKNALPSCVARGFTLLEMLIVVLIMGIALAIAAPSTGFVGNSQRDDAVTQLQLALEQAVFESVLAGQEVMFVSSGNAYRFERRDDEGTWLLAEADGPLRARVLPDSVRIERAWLDNQPQRGNPQLFFVGSAPPLFRLWVRNGERMVQLQSTPAGAVEQTALEGVPYAR
jgi:general secretion pathway protein H